MDNALTIAAVVALIIGAIAEFQSNGRDLAAWGVIALAVGILLSHFG